jgi:hypothetical protein
MRFDRHQSAGPRNGRVVRRPVWQPQAEKIAQRKRICRAPGDAALRIDAFEVSDQQQPEIDARRQAGTAHGLGVKAGALRFDEIVESVLPEQLIQTSVKGVACGGWYVCGWDPHRRLPIAFPFAHRHGRSVVRDLNRVLSTA